MKAVHRTMQDAAAAFEVLFDAKDDRRSCSTSAMDSGL
jgi:hypothetical protein